MQFAVTSDSSDSKITKVPGNARLHLRPRVREARTCPTPLLGAPPHFMLAPYFPTNRQLGFTKPRVLQIFSSLFRRFFTVYLQFGVIYRWGQGRMSIVTIALA